MKLLYCLNDVDAKVVKIDKSHKWKERLVKTVWIILFHANSGILYPHFIWCSDLFVTFASYILVSCGHEWCHAPHSFGRLSGQKGKVHHTIPHKIIELYARNICSRIRDAGVAHTQVGAFGDSSKETWHQGLPPQHWATRPSDATSRIGCAQTYQANHLGIFAQSGLPLV